MSELVRPSPRPSARRRAARRVELLLTATTPARVATSAGALLLVAVAAWWLLRTPAPPVEQALPRAPAATATTASSRSTSTQPDELVVQVAGAVVQPGVYRVANGSRVGDVLARAGGPTPDADPSLLNLAARVVDGERVYVPRVGEVVVTVAPPANNTGSAPSPATPIDLNSAGVDQLETLPGIGPSTAQAIVDQRERNGPFRSVDDLLDVRGIGPAKLDAIRDLVRV